MQHRGSQGQLSGAWWHFRLLFRFALVMQGVVRLAASSQLWKMPMMPTSLLN